MTCNLGVILLLLIPERINNVQEALLGIINWRRFAPDLQELEIRGQLEVL